MDVYRAGITMEKPEMESIKKTQKKKVIQVPKNNFNSQDE